MIGHFSMCVSFVGGKGRSEFGRKYLYKNQNLKTRETGSKHRIESKTLATAGLTLSKRLTWLWFALLLFWFGCFGSCAVLAFISPNSHSILTAKHFLFSFLSIFTYIFFHSRPKGDSHFLFA